MPIQFDALKKYPATDLYRFIVDGSFHAQEMGWFGYESREEGSLGGAMDALWYAISTYSEPLTIELIQEIHKKATTPVLYRRASFNPGVFRQHSTSFLLLHQEHKEGYCSIDGLRDLAQFVNDNQFFGCAIIKSERNFFKMVRQLGRSAKQEDYMELSKSIQSEHDHASDCSTDIAYENLSEQKYFFRPPTANLDLLVQQHINTYNQLDLHDMTDDQKLGHMIDLIQSLERVHPFHDGNGRTFYILLQRLLIQNGFLPTILWSPNRIDGFSREEVKAEIRRGMDMTLMLIEHPDNSVYDHKTSIIDIHDVDDYEGTNGYSYGSVWEVEASIEAFYDAQAKFAALIQSLPDVDLSYDEPSMHGLRP